MIASIIGGLFELMFFLLCGILSLAGFVFWIGMLIHALTNKSLGDGERIAWVLVIIFLPVIGSIIYFFVGRPKTSVA